MTIRRVVPWLIATALGVLSVTLLVHRPAEEPASPDATTAQPARDGAASPAVGDASSPENVGLAPNQRCMARLARARAALDVCHDQRGSADAHLELTPEARTCLDRPQVQRLVETRCEEAVARHVAAESQRHGEAREIEEAAVRGLLTESLGLTADESRWVTEYVCTVRELRQQALDEMSPDGASATETVERIRAERREHLADLEEYLGAERFARLRSIGGIGLLADVLPCGEERAAPALDSPTLPAVLP